jgi:hypothetical protein
MGFNSGLKGLNRSDAYKISCSVSTWDLFTGVKAT